MVQKTIPQFAKDTKVPVDKTESEIKKTLQAYQADGIAIGNHGDRQMIAFLIDDVQIRYAFDLPREEDFAKNSIGKPRGAVERRAVWEQALRTIWRVMLHRIKDRLMLAFSPFSCVYDEFFREIVLSDGTTMGERYTEEQYREMRRQNQLPSMLPGLKALPPGREE